MANSLDFLWENGKENSAFLDKKNVHFFLFIKKSPQKPTEWFSGKVLAAKSEDLSSIPGTHGVDGES